MASTVGNLNPEVWVKDIAENMFPDDSFISFSKDDTGDVDGGRTVHLNQAGSASGVEEDRSTLPATASGRTDTILTYELRSYTSNPVVIRNAEELETNYDKRRSVMQNDMQALLEFMCKRAGYEWAKNPQALLRTTGSLRGAEAAGATGNRKALTPADFKAARVQLNRTNIPLKGRVAVLTAQMYEDLTGDTTVANASYLGKVTLPDGVIDRFAGFDIMMRTEFARFDNTATPVAKAPAAVSAATDNLASLFYHPDFVRRAKGMITPFIRENDPLYYGTVLSFEAFAGFSRAYTRGLGIVTMVEGV